MGGAASLGRLREVVAGAVARGTQLSPRDAVALALKAAEAAAGGAPGDLFVCGDGSLRGGSGDAVAPAAAAAELAALITDLLAGRSGSNSRLQGMPLALGGILARALGDDPKGRFPDMASLVAAFRSAVGAELAGERELAELLVRLGEPGGRVTLGQIGVARVPASALQPAPQQDVKVPERRAMRGRLLGEILVARGRLETETLDRTLHQQTRGGGLLGEILVAEGFVGEGDVVRALSEQTGIPFVSEAKVAEMAVPRDVVALLPLERAERLGVLPLSLRGKELTCAMVEPRDLAVLDELKFLVGVPSVRGAFATEGTIRRGLGRFYRGEIAEQAGSWESTAAQDEAEAPSPAPLAAGTPWPPAPPMLPWVARPVAPPVAPVAVAAPAEGSDAWEIPSALLVPDEELPTALLLEEETPAAVTRMRAHLLGALLAERTGIGALPALVRRMAMRLGASSAEVERVAAAAEAAVLLAGPGPFRCPDRARFEAALPDDAAELADLFDLLEGGAPAGAAAAAFGAGITFVEAVGTAIPDAEAAATLLGLQRDPRLQQEAFLALAAEVAATFPQEAGRVLVAIADPAAAAPVVAELLAARIPTLEVQQAVELRLALGERLVAAVVGDLPDSPAAALVEQLRAQPGLERLPVIEIGKVPALEAGAAVIAALAALAEESDEAAVR